MKVSLKKILGKWHGKQLDIVFPLIRFFTDRDLADKMSPWEDYEISPGKKINDNYLMFGSDIGGDRLIGKKDLTGPVYIFNHESPDFKHVKVAKSLKDFLDICDEIKKSEKKLDISSVGPKKFTEEYHRIRDVIKAKCGKSVPEFWTVDFVDYEEFWNEDGEYIGPE